MLPTDPLGHVAAYTYDANGNRLSETRIRTLPGGGTETLVTQYEYDALNRLVKTTQPDGSTTRTVYNAIGKQSQTLDPLSRVTSYEYDAAGRLVKTVYPDGTAEASSYDAEGRRLTSTDRAGRETNYIYDALGRLTETIYPDGAHTTTMYDAAGQVIASTDALGQVTHYEYDDAGRRAKVIDALGHVTTFTYDAAGNQIQVTDASNHVTTFVYDGNRCTQVVYPDSTKELIAYDALGRTVKKTDQAGKETRFTYDALGRLIKVTDALNQETTYGYDEQGNQISQTDANGHVTTFAYDRQGRRIARQLPLGQTESMTYDAAGNLVSKTDFNGKVTTYAYDSLNRLVSKMPDPDLSEPTVSYTYTTSGQRAAMTDATGTTNYTYDNRDRLTEKATPQGTLTYSYHANGSLAGIQSNHADGVKVEYEYDALNRLSKVTDQRLSAGETTYHYDAVGNLAGYVYPNGVEHQYTYNALNRLTDLNVKKGNAALSRYTYTLGPSGNRLSVAELGGRTVSYGYDDLYRLTRETISGGSGPTGEISYVYDPVGNRLQRTSTVAGIANQIFTYDANDRLNTEAYDANGNTTGTDGKTFAYDFENHLAAMNAGEVGIVYDGDGNRVAKTVGGVTTQYLVDDRNPTGYAQVLEEIENGAVVRSYTYGLDLISQNQSGEVSFYGYDGHGSVRLLTDAAGNLTDTYDYEGFGNLIAQTGTTENVYLYAGEQVDQPASLYYLRARSMNPAIGRFLSPDTFLGFMGHPSTMHKYLYANDNPVNHIDPSGQVALTEVVLINGADDVLVGVRVQVRWGGAVRKAKSIYEGVFVEGRPLAWLVAGVGPITFHFDPTNLANHSFIRIVVSDDPSDEENRLVRTKQSGATRGGFGTTIGGDPDSSRLLTAYFGESGDMQERTLHNPAKLDRGMSKAERYALIRELFEASDRYNTKRTYYKPIPPYGPGEGYNSNSFAAGLLSFIGKHPEWMAPFSIDSLYPGWNTPVPGERF
jgi:RHS repeat-associated protein